MEVPADSGVVRLQSTVFRSITLQVCEARNLPKLRGVFASVHLSSQMGRTAVFHKTRNPLWADEFTFEVVDPHDVVKVFVMEDKKKGVQKKVGEIRVILATLPLNQKTEAWLPIAGEKNKTVGDVRLRLNYSVDVLLPSAEYNPFLELIGAEDLEIIRLVSRFARENKSEVARDLVYIFQSKGRVEWLIGQLLKEEINSTDSQEVLFRSNSVCTKALDHYMKLLGQEYLTGVVKPLVHAVQKLPNTLEVDKNRLVSSDDYKKNLKMIQIILEDLVNRLTISLDQCPVPLRRLFAVIDRLAKEKFKDSEKIRYTAVGGFIFLRFFVPAILNPKLFGLMEHLPDDKQSRTLSLLAGVLQKIANLTKYRDGDDYHVLLNDFITAKTLLTKEYVDKLIDVPEAPLTRSRSMTRRLSSVSPVIQVEHHIASLLRELEPVIPKFKDELFRPNVVKLLEILDKLEKRVKAESESMELSDLGSKSPSTDVDSLVSDLIRSSISGQEPATAARSRSASSAATAQPARASNRKTVRRLKKREEPTQMGVDQIFAAPGLTDTRAASSAYSKQEANARASMGIKLGGPVADISAFTAKGTQEKQDKQQVRSFSPPPQRPAPLAPEAQPAAPTGEGWKPVTAAGAVLMNLRKDQMMQRKGSAPPVPQLRSSQRQLAGAAEAVARVDATNSPRSRISDSPRQKALAPHKDPAPQLQDDGVPIGSSLDDELQAATSSLELEIKPQTPRRDSAAAQSESSKVLADLNRLLQLEADAGVSVEATSQVAVAPEAPPEVAPAAAPEPVVVAAPVPKVPVSEPKPQVSPSKPPAGLIPTMPLAAINVPAPQAGDLITPRRAIVTLTPRNEVLIEEEVEDELAALRQSEEVEIEDESSSDDEDDMEEVEVIDMDAARGNNSSAIAKMDAEFQALNSLIDEIIHFERPATPRQRPPEEVIPDILALDEILGQLNSLQIETSRKMKEEHAKAVSQNRRRSLAPAMVVCHQCKGGIAPGQGFLIALERQYHENHLLCNRCNVDLSRTGLHDYKGDPYCTKCYTYVSKIETAPRCAGCHEPILDEEYFTALEQTWHVEHFVCTTCHKPFDDGRFFMVNGKPFCDQHSRVAKPKQSRGICDYCQQDIFDSEYMDAQGKKWHKEHFLCDKCGLPMEGVFVLYDKGRKKGCAHHFQK
eukprot:TRINITY_DN2883_c0_g2_i1.p1 TRINITY_DN2883_c0_g2~~TRINITY_DN2883_c0_g2_i1.p1  ORF type:complete len:1169 (+),score=254.82 TRINITY_DN2883_c0_g2_i1:170-3676(+)